MSEHVRLGGSKAHRFLVCLASPRLEQEAGEQPPGEAALDGTTAHYVAERCLMTGCDPYHPSFLGQQVMGRKVTMEMAESVEVYVEWARNMQVVMPSGKFHFELPVTLAKLDPPEDMRGASDFVGVFRDLSLLVVGDYKHGIGYRVEVKGNKQLRYYALAALLSLPDEEARGIEKVQLTIIQPRIYHPDGVIRSDTIDINELIDFADDLIRTAIAIQRPDAPAVPGDHCLFCNAASTCKARAEWAVTSAQDEFEVVLKSQPISSESGLPDVGFLSIEELADLVQRAEPFVERAATWVRAAKERLHREALTREVPGFKLVAKRATRVWVSPDAVIKWASDQCLTDNDIYEPRELKSPAQIEAVVGKKGLPATLYSKVSTGFNLAPASSSRPAARLLASDEFSTAESTELDEL